MDKFQLEKQFIRHQIIDEIRGLLDDNHTLAAFVFMAQSIEVLGSYLDTKPFRARAQSKIRFGNALYHLFPGKYSFVNKGSKLYDQFRSSMTHMFIPSSHLILKRESNRHLEMQDDKLILSAETLFKDIQNAGEKVLQMLENGELKQKKINYLAGEES